MPFDMHMSSMIALLVGVPVLGCWSHTSMADPHGHLCEQETSQLHAWTLKHIHNASTCVALIYVFTQHACISMISS